MKTQALLLSISLAVAGISSAHAQFPRPAVVHGTALGAIAGAFIGGHNNDRWAQGAVIGAAAGALIGAAVDQPSPRRAEYNPCFAPVGTVATEQSCAPVYAVQQSYAQPASQVVYVQQAQPQQIIYVQRAAPTQVVYVQAPTCAPTVVIAVPNHHRHRGGNVVYVGPGYSRW